MNVPPDGDIEKCESPRQRGRKDAQDAPETIFHERTGNDEDQHLGRLL